jgi:hypothetical protein
MGELMRASDNRFFCTFAGMRCAGGSTWAKSEGCIASKSKTWSQNARDI